MAKSLLHHYTFTPSTDTIVIQGIYARERFLLITNATREQTIYTFNDGGSGFYSIAFDYDAETTTVVLDYVCSAMSSTDKLQIFVELDYQVIEPSPTFYDPVSKLRVSNPENLIDTDFEYGLQSTKWETLELVKNIPTFFSRNGDESLVLVSVSSNNASEIITVVTQDAHGLSIGNPIIVQGTSSISANGAFVVTKVVDATSFQYKAKDTQSFTGTIFDTYTQVFVASVYQGTEFQLGDLNAITTDAASPSTITVTTEYPTNFSTGTSFFLSNSVGSKIVDFNSASIVPTNTVKKLDSVTNVTPTGSGDFSEWSVGAANPMNWTPYPGYSESFIPGTGPEATVTVDLVADTITFPNIHNLADDQSYMFYTGIGNTAIGGLGERWYYVRVIDSYTIYLTLTLGSTVRVNLTSAGAFGGMQRSWLAYCLVPTAANTATEEFTFSNSIAISGDVPWIAAYTTVSSLTVLAGSAALVNNFQDGSGIAVYLSATGANTATVSNTYGGATRNLTSATVGGCLVVMRPDALGSDRNSIYFPKGNFADSDLVRFYATSTAPSGLSSTSLYTLEACGASYPNRFRFKGIYPLTTEINFTSYGAVGTTQFSANQFDTVVNVAQTGETEGWPMGATQPMNWLPEEAVFFVAGVGATANVTVDIAADTVTFSTPHGITDNTTYVYWAGVGNGLIGGLTDSRWYWIRVVDANTIYFTLTDGGTVKVNLTSAGTSADMMRSCLARAYRATAIDVSSEVVTFAEPLSGAVSGGSNTYMACYTTLGSFYVFGASSTLMSFIPGGGQVYYPKQVSTSGTQVVFSAQIGGTTFNHGGATVAGIMIRVAYSPDANSIWFPNHGYSTDDTVVFLGSSTVPGGMGSGTYYSLNVVNSNRLAFRNLTATAPVDLTSYGAVGTTFFSIYSCAAYDANGDFIPVNNHGLNDSDLVSYSKQSGVEIGGLTNGNSYYVFNSGQNQFQLATTYSGFDGSALVFDQNVARIPSGNYYISIPGAGHGFTTGDRVQYLSASPLPGLENGGLYYVYRYGVSTMSLHLSLDGALVDNVSTRIYFGYPLAGTGSLRKTTALDLTTAGTLTQRFTASAPGSSDGVYTIDSIVSPTQFTLAAPNQLPDRAVTFVGESSVWIEQDAIYIPDHYFVTGQAVVYTVSGGSAVGGLVDATTYYIIRASRNWVKLAASEVDAFADTVIDLTSEGTGVHSFTTDSLSGQIVGGGTLSVNAGANAVVGSETNFTSFFNTGDTISMYAAPSVTNVPISTVTTATNLFTSATANTLLTEDMVVMDAVTAPTGTTNGTFYYVRVVSAGSTFTLHPTAADAAANTNTVALSSTGSGVAVFKYDDIGATYEYTIGYVTSPTTLEIIEEASTTLTNADYAVGTSLLMRADGYAIHRPYDGGVELIPSTNPDSSMIRQTRRYFRYQSGKGIQVSYAVNFSPSIQIDGMTAVGTTATIRTRYPHRLSTGLQVVVSGATTTGANNYWNGTFTVASVVNDYTFTVTLTGTPTPDATSGPGGLPEFYVVSWANSSLRCGLFDDQNGLYFEFDGTAMKVCRRNSTIQISGVASVQFKSGLIVGTNTRFQQQLAIGDKIVIKGQTYLITAIDSNTAMYVLPAYRGASASNVIITKTIDVKVPQNEWNIDKCDGTGPTGFFLRYYRIQMAYIDYSWYGAGKVRFGFKDQNGIVRYVHEFIHNNKQNEAYLRSGNLPGRYEIENIGAPTYVPALAHWGTSVIMDGGFDPDSAYLFTASSTNIQLTGSATVAVTGRVETQQDYVALLNGRWVNIGRALYIDTPSFVYNSIGPSLAITGANLSGATTRQPAAFYGLPNQPYQVSLVTRIGSVSNTASELTRNLILLNGSLTGVAGSNSAYTVTVAATGVPVVYDVPLISIRLSPSVDTNTPGFLGEREIINRMQLILNSVGILSTHSAKVTLRLNGLVTNTEWERVENPSLSQLIYHTNQDQITGGIDIFDFRAQGGTGTTGRTAVVTAQDLAGITTLGNAILGGNNVFPDGPDVLTIVATLAEDPSTVSNSNPFNITGRITWTESQA